MPRLRRVPRSAPRPQPNVQALAINWPYDERHGRQMGAWCPRDGWIPPVQAGRYRIAEAPLEGFDPYNAVIYQAGIYHLARLDPAPTERPFWPPRLELAESIRRNLERP